jgi:hypothetical protein
MERVYWFQTTGELYLLKSAEVGLTSLSLPILSIGQKIPLQNEGVFYIYQV